jgi:hypothetical protein
MRIVKDIKTEEVEEEEAVEGIIAEGEATIVVVEVTTVVAIKIKISYQDISPKKRKQREIKSRNQKSNLSELSIFQ